MSSIKTVEEMRSLADTAGLCGGMICWDDKCLDVEILYLSPTGARICLVDSEAEQTLGDTTKVIFKIDRFQDLRATIIWRQDSIVGLQFDGTMSLDDLISTAPAHNAQPFGGEKGERRTLPRKRVMLAASLELSDGAHDCRILDISLVGARLQVNDDTPSEELMQLATTRFGLLPVEMMWRLADHMGVQFLESPSAISMILKDFLTE